MPSATRCYCPDDCSCRSPYRPTCCGCRAHDSGAMFEVVAELSVDVDGFDAWPGR